MKMLEAYCIISKVNNIRIKSKACNSKCFKYRSDVAFICKKKTRIFYFI